jgi:ActR/RegA family two-component response regulator
MTHYHIRWSGKALLDWQRFNTPEEAKESARQLVRQGETYGIEQHDETCPRCEAAMNVKSMHGSFNEACP